MSSDKPVPDYDVNDRVYVRAPGRIVQRGLDDYGFYYYVRLDDEDVLGSLVHRTLFYRAEDLELK